MWFLVASAGAVTLALQSSSSPHPGVTIEHYRASSPSTDVTVARVDLCAAGVRVDATPPTSSSASTGSYAAAVDAQLASNGDFYTSGPSVYGNAVGQGIPWPVTQTGDDPGDASEWFYERYGWIAFGADAVWFTHTEWTKDNTAYGQGWAPDELAPTPPPGTIALVSGFPELVVEGDVVSCTSPTADDCFPDRTDMRSRHPRTAMGLTQDLETFLLVAVDGRTSSNAGMYGSELASTLDALGAWQAFNLDGGGSTQLWAGTYMNDATGNNGGSSARSVGNHWGVFAPGSGRAGSCVSATPCDVLPAAGGVLDDASSCFQLFGDPAYWRSEDDGHDGHLYWTNAFDTDVPENHAWWHIALQAAGQYHVEAWVEPSWSGYDQPRYRIVHDGVEDEVRVDPTGEGWVSLGQYDFSAGGDQLVAVYDDAPGDPGSSARVVADAIRLTRLDGQDSSAPVDSAPADSAQPETDAPDGVADRDATAQLPWDRQRLSPGCAATPVVVLGLGLLLVRRRQRTG